MNKKDKDNMIILGALVGIIFLFFFFNFITRKIYFIVLVGIILGVQTFLIIPAICKYYYILNDQEATYERYIPFYQELTIFPPTLAKFLAFLWVGTAILFLIITLGSKSGALGSVLGLEVIVTIERVFGDTLANILALVLIVSNFATGAGFMHVRKDVMRMDTEFSGRVNKRSVVELFYYIVLYIPVFRCLALCNIWNTLLRLTKLNKYKPALDNSELYEDN